MINRQAAIGIKAEKIESAVRFIMDHFYGECGWSNGIGETESRYLVEEIVSFFESDEIDK